MKIQKSIIHHHRAILAGLEQTSANRRKIAEELFKQESFENVSFVFVPSSLYVSVEPATGSWEFRLAPI